MHHRTRIVTIQRILPPKLIRKLNGEGHAVHLDCTPMHRAVEPHVLTPAAVLILGTGKIKQRRACRARVATGQLRHCRLAQITGPDHVIPADVFVGPSEAPRERKARNERSGESFGLVRLHDRGADAVHVQLAA